MRDDIRKRIEMVNPEALEILEEIDRNLQPGISVTTTDDMSPEEEEFELTAGFMAEGFSYEAARQKAKQWHTMMDGMFTKTKV